jgi:hypothetical protein
MFGRSGDGFYSAEVSYGKNKKKKIVKEGPVDDNVVLRFLYDIGEYKNNNKETFNSKYKGAMTDQERDIKLKYLERIKEELAKELTDKKAEIDNLTKHLFLYKDLFYSLLGIGALIIIYNLIVDKL